MKSFFDFINCAPYEKNENPCDRTLKWMSHGFEITNVISFFDFIVNIALGASQSVCLSTSRLVHIANAIHKTTTVLFSVILFRDD